MTRSGNTAFDFEVMGAVDCAGMGNLARSRGISRTTVSRSSSTSVRKVRRSPEEHLRLTGTQEPVTLRQQIGNKRPACNLPVKGQTAIQPVKAVANAEE